jgi:ABC-type multidrug transport system fused ATPase/permease subunit
MNRAELKTIKNFIPAEIWKMIFIAALVGVFNFLVESSMIIILQGILVSLGLMSKELANLPSFYPTTVLPAFLCVGAFGLFRSLSLFFKNHLACLAQYRFSRIVREKVMDVAIRKGNIVAHDEVLSYFSEIVSQAGNVIFYINLMTSSLICAGLLFLLGLYVTPVEMLIGVMFLGLIVFPYAKYGKTIKKSGAGLVYEWERINNVLLVALKNNFFIKVFNLGDKELEKSKGILKGYESHLRKYSSVSSFFVTLPSFLGVLVVCFITIIGKEYLNTSSVKLLGFYYIFIRFSQFSSESYSSFSFFSLNYEGIKRLINWLNENGISLTDKKPMTAVEVKEADPITLSIEKLTFGYGQVPLFNDLNFNLSRGHFLLIKGPSGSGKSTLLNLLFGFIQPDEGRVLFNGAEGIKNMEEIIGYVGPEPYLIPGSIRENLLYGSLKSFSDEELMNSLDKVGLRELVQNFPQKLDQPLSDHAQISTGQKQRLSLARTLLRDLKILILDEATSNIDHQTEDNIIKVLNDLKEKVITIAVTHKDSFDGLATSRLYLGDIKK